MNYEITGKVLMLFSFKRKGERIDIDSAHTFCKNKTWVEYPVRQHETMTLKVNTEIEADSKKEAIETLKEELEKPETWTIGIHDEDDNYLNSLQPEEIKVVELNVTAEEIEIDEEELASEKLWESVDRLIDERKEARI